MVRPDTDPTNTNTIAVNATDVLRNEKPSSSTYIKRIWKREEGFVSLKDIIGTVRS